MAVPLGRAWDIFDRAVAQLAPNAGPDTTFFPTGGLRRFDPIVLRMGVIARTRDPEALLRAGHDVIVDGQPVRIQAHHPHHFGAALIKATGTSAHVAQLDAHAGGSIDSLAGATEDDVYAALHLSCVPPEIRDGRDEVARAEAGDIPALVTRKHIRGDLHLHTRYSDGRDDVETMVATAAGLGYEYIAITDHSPSSAATRVLSHDSLQRQIDDIDQVQVLYPAIRILKGVEVDILADGSLDLPDHLLERLDIVLASLHDAADHPPGKLLERYLSAAKHPFVNILTHPANQLVGRRAGYDLDYDRLFETAATTGTILEIDGAPSHLDLDGTLARRAAAAGAMFAIDSDCHHARLMSRHMLFGVATARRGWIEPASVINTSSLPDLLAVLAAKRAGRA